MRLIKSRNNSTYLFFIVFGIIGLTLALAARFVFPYGIGYSCVFKKIFKIPCITCGTSRVFYYLGSLEITEAFLSNPMISMLIIIMILLMISAVVSLLLKFPIYKIVLSDAEKSYIIGGTIALVIANWIYLIIAKI